MPRNVAEAEVELNRYHQLFLQAMLLRRALPRSKVIEIWIRCGDILGIPPESRPQEEFSDFLEACNKRLQGLDFEIKSTMDQGIGGVIEREDAAWGATNGSGGKGGGGWVEARKEGTNWLALVNTKSDDLAKVATDFNANEIAFFRKIVDRIIRAPNSRYCIKHHDAIRLCNKIDPPLKKADAQRILGTFVKKGWLSVSSKAVYSLSVRAELELDRYLTQTFDEDDILSCNVCSDIVFRGWRCVNCSVAMHSGCLKRWLTTRPATQRDCPHCRQVWTQGTPVGEDAPEGEMQSDSESEAEEEGATQGQSGRRKSGSAKKGSVNKKRGRDGKRKLESDEEEETEEEEDEESDEAEERKPRRTSGRKTSAHKLVASQADDDEDEESESEEEG